MSEPRTHLKIDSRLCGRPQELGPGLALVQLDTSAEMAADEQGLVHGGFVFGAADYAAMLAVNDPNVVLGAAQTRFLRPLRVGQAVLVRATVAEEKGKKREVEVIAREGENVVFEGSFTCFVLDKHVLE